MNLKKILECIKNAFKKVSSIFFVGASDALPEPLSKEEELKYLKEAKEGNVDAKNKLIEHNLRLVVYLSKKYENTKGKEWYHINRTCGNNSCIINSCRN